MDLTSALQWRHTAKAYDASRRIPQDKIDTLLNVLRMGPSSVNSQPWHFVVASDEAGRARMAKATGPGFTYNEPKVTQASHVIALCIRNDLDDEYLKAVLEKEVQDGRFTGDGAREGQDKSRRGYVNIHRYDRRDLPQWSEKQLYLALGALLLAAATLEIDATPMEGIDARALDLELGLREKGFSTVVLVSLGYHGEQDFNADLPKSPLSAEDVFTFL